jgi:phospholipid/cholesterol/gamma-HCH transport system permease protein
MTAEAGRLDITLADDRLTVALRGRWTIDAAAALDADIDARIDRAAFGTARRARIDLSGLAAIDSAGAMLLARLRDRIAAIGEVETIGVRPDHGALIDRVAASAGASPPAPVPHQAFVALLTRVGRATCLLGDEAVDLLNFLGLTVVSIVRGMANPARIRFVSFVSHMERVGLDAMPIVGLLSFLIGVVVAYQGADQLRQFGAEIFTVNLLGISIMREMGIILTAVVVAGRSGSAFAAQIGTMQVNQEVDAMRTLGLDPVEILVLPRMLALVIAMPLLGVYADIMGLAGGAFMSIVTLDISLAQYFGRLRDAIGIWTFWVGIIKAPVFGFLIALTGCREGLKVGGSAESVGLHTTRAVVISIFLVIVTDAIFSILFSVIHI